MKNTTPRFTIENKKEIIDEIVAQFKATGVFKKNITAKEIDDFKLISDEKITKLFSARQSYLLTSLLNECLKDKNLSVYFNSKEVLKTTIKGNNNKSFENFIFDNHISLSVILGVLLVGIIVTLVFTIITDSSGLLMLVAFLISIFGLTSYFLWTKYYGKINKKHGPSENLPLWFKIPGFFILAGAFLWLYYYIVLPPLSLQSASFIFFLMLILIFVALIIIYSLHVLVFSKKAGKKYTYERVNVISLCSIVGLTLVYALTGTLTGVDLFRAGDLARLLEIESIDSPSAINGDFDYAKGDIILPTLDKDMSYRKAEIALGDYGNQYYLNQDHFSIQALSDRGVDKMIRVAPLEYSNLFISLQHNDIGTPGYILVDLSTGETSLHDEYPLIYTENSKLSTDLMRYFRYHNVSSFYDNVYFEIDDDYIPYWVVPCYQKRVGLFNGKVPTEVVTINANTGDIQHFNVGEAPRWIDNVVDRQIVEELADFALRYQKGYINATIGTKDGVFSLNDGYNYFIKNGESFYVSSVTSSDDRDQTSIGILTISLRTMEAKFYKTAGITEDRAMDVAAFYDIVKPMNLTATWPVFIMVENTPTFFLTLKNEVQVQKYVFINQKNGDLPIIGDTIAEAYHLYLAHLGVKDTQIKVSGLIERIRFDEKNVYFNLQGDSEKRLYRSKLSLSPQLNLLKIGDFIEFACLKQDDIYSIVAIKQIDYLPLTAE